MAKDDKPRNGFDLNITRNTGKIYELPLNETSTTLFFSEISGRETKYVLDNGSEDFFVCRAQMAYANSLEFARKTDRSKIAISRAIREFCDFIKNLDQKENHINNSDIVDGDFKRYLIKSGRAESTIKNTLRHVHGSISSIKDNKALSHLFESETLRKIVLKKKSYQYESQKKPGLTEIFPDFQDGTSEIDLLVGLKELTTWFLESMNQIRKTLIDNSSILASFVGSLGNEKFADLDDWMFTHIPNNSYRLKYGYKHEYEPLYKELHNTILNNKDDPFLKLAMEIWAYETSQSHVYRSAVLFDEIYTEDETEFVFHSHASTYWKRYEKFIDDSGILKCFFYDIKSPDKKEPRVINTVNSISLSFLAYPSASEQLAMLWLLASERIQSAGLEKLKLSNIYHDKKKKQIQIASIVKRRRQEKTETPLYHNDLMYKTYSEWENLITNAMNRFGDFGNLLIPNYENGYLYKKNRIYFATPLNLIAIEGTSWNKALKNHFKGSTNEQKVLSFLKLLKCNDVFVRKRMDANCEYANKKTERINRGIQPASDRTSNRFARKGDNIKTLTPDVIAQSRANIDDKIESGRLVGHNIETHENVYKNRTKSKSVNAESATWAADIGNKMIEEAAILAEHTKLISIEDVKEALGIKGVFSDLSEEEKIQDIVDAAELEGYTADLMTGLSKNGETYIVVSDITAALIQGYINKIDNDLNSIERNNTLKAQQLSIKKIYLKILLDKFPPQHINQADKILEKYELPFPSLV